MIRIDSLTKSFSAVPLIDRQTFHFPDGEKIALIGANGSGKTTLLNIICGLEEKDSGSIIYPANSTIGYLPQAVNPHPKQSVLEECLTGAGLLYKLREEMATALKDVDESACQASLVKYESAQSSYQVAGGYALESMAHEILVGLGFTEEMIKMSPGHLSGGWRMRLELGKIFLKNPDFLILDEPTNHLDLPSLVWVERFLQSFRGTLLFVSHDRPLLNRLATHIVHLQRGKLQSYKGNFDAFLTQQELHREQEQARAVQLQKKIGQMERFVERFGSQATKASQAQSRVKMIARLRLLEQDIDIDPNEMTIHFSIPEATKSGREVLLLQELAIGYDRPLAEGIHMLLERGSKVAVIGANGIGKSTLLKTVFSLIAPLAGSLRLGYGVKPAYFAQEHLERLESGDSVLDTILKTSHGIGEREARSLLGSFLFRGDDVYKRVQVLSGGEKARVVLATLLVERANFLLLDEPTNHLDMTSVEMLVGALSDYQGSMLFVSHDRQFIDSLATHIFVMLPDGRSMLFAGKLEDYERAAVYSGFPNVLAITPPITAENNRGVKAGSAIAEALPDERERAKSLRRERSRLSKRRDQLDAEQNAYRLAIKKAQDFLLTVSPADYEELNRVNLRLRGDEGSLREAEDEWLSVCEELESLEEELREMGRS